jgi:putative nucleotidyltransferase with HDIG domain
METTMQRETVEAIRLPSAINQFPSLPRALLKAQQLINDPTTEQSELLEVIRLDPGLTGTLLRLVNSAYYGLPERITDLQVAVEHVGYEMTEAVVLSTSAGDRWLEGIPSYSQEQGMLWKHSIAVAFASEALALRYGITPSSDAYVAGLFHDIGKLAMDLVAIRRPKQLGAANQEEDSSTWTQFEQQIARRSHAEVGAIVVRVWNLPDRVVEAVACHHCPSQSQLAPRFTALVHMADLAAAKAGFALSVDKPHITSDACAAALLDWTDADLAQVAAYAKDAVLAAQRLLDVAV